MSLFEYGKGQICFPLYGAICFHHAILHTHTNTPHQDKSLEMMILSRQKKDISLSRALKTCQAKPIQVLSKSSQPRYLVELQICLKKKVKKKEKEKTKKLNASEEDVPEENFNCFQPYHFEKKKKQGAAAI